MEKFNYLWHYDVHERFGQSLLYLQLGFFPLYRKKEVRNQILDFLEKKKICSYCLYETYGHYDLLLRVWLPSQSLIHFPKELQDGLKILGCTKVIPFFVEKNPLHWMWMEGNDKILSPSNIDCLLEGTVNEAESGGKQSVINELKEQHIIKDYSSHKGIKFFIVIPPPSGGDIPPELVEENIISKLKNILIEIDGIIEPSIYVGNGFAWILLKGKVLFEKYNELNMLVQKIPEAGVFCVRTYTYLVADPDYTIEKDKIGVSIPISAEDDIISYIQREEDERFEIKSSLSFNLDRYLRDKSHTVDLRDEKTAKDGVLKSIVGFLNAEGGKILIGLIEKEKYGDVLKKPDNLLSGLPEIEGKDRIIFGINNEYTPAGWDGFVRRLTDLIRAHIGEDASIIVRPQKYTYKDSKDLCLIDVPKGKRWYYLDEKQFYVRRVGSTELLEGRSMDDYKKWHYR
ncbi:MAG: ATP-binding protein [bacterium]|nr:ATP-binding protein [bacterium]